MKKIILIIGLVFFFACKKDEANPSIIESKVTVSDNFAADGCQLTIWINDSSFTSDVAGKKLVNDFVKDSFQNGFLHAKVILGYQMLNTKDTIFCGWNSYKLSKTLKISYIKPNK